MTLLEKKIGQAKKFEKVGRVIALVGGFILGVYFGVYFGVSSLPDGDFDSALLMPLLLIGIAISLPGIGIVVASMIKRFQCRAELERSAYPRGICPACDKVLPEGDWVACPSCGATIPERLRLRQKK